MQESKSIKNNTGVTNPMKSDDDEDRSDASSFDGNEILREHGEMKEKINRIRNILISHSLPDSRKIQESLAVLSQQQNGNNDNNDEVIDVLQRSVRGEQIEPQTLQDKIGAALRKMEELQNQKEFLRGESRELRAENMILKQKLERLTQQRNEYKEELDNIKRSKPQEDVRSSLGLYLDGLNKKLSESQRQEIEEPQVNRELDTLKQEYQRQIRQLISLSDENSRKQGEVIKRHEVNIRELTQKCNELGQLNSFLKRQNTKLVDDFKSRGQSLEQEKRRLEQINTNLSILEKETQKKLRAMIEKSNSREDEIRQLKQRVVELNQENERQRANLKSKEAETVSYKQEISKIKKLSTDNKKVADLQRLNKDFISRIEVQNKELQELKIYITKLQADIIYKNRQNDILKGEKRKEAQLKDDEAFGIGLRHRDQISQWTKKYNQAAEKILKLEAIVNAPKQNVHNISQVMELEQLLALIAHVITQYPIQQRQQKKKEICQSVSLMK